MVCRPHTHTRTHVFLVTHVLLHSLLVDHSSTRSFFVLHTRPNFLSLGLTHVVTTYSDITTPACRRCHHTLAFCCTILCADKSGTNALTKYAPTTRTSSCGPEQYGHHRRHGRVAVAHDTVVSRNTVLAYNIVVVPKSIIVSPNHVVVTHNLIVVART